MKINDIRPIKTELRKKAKSDRQKLTEQSKAELDGKVADNLFLLYEYNAADTLLCYVSTDIEVDTSVIIKRALQQNKKVAVPKCIDGTRNMDFYFLNSYEDLESGAFGVFEPITSKCEKLTDLSGGICIVPALVFDVNGYRLGYGKGYYDRFLAHFGGKTLGLAYEFGVTAELPHGKYDRQTDIIITDSRIIKLNERRICDNG